MPRKFVAVDPEGHVGEEGLIGCAFYSAAGGQYLTDRAAIEAELRRLAVARHTFLSHNIEHDIPLLWWELGLSMSTLYYNNTVNRGEWKYAPHRPPAELWDTVDLSGGLRLSDLGLALGLPKYQTPQTLRGIDPDRYEWKCDEHGVWECLSCYAIRDAEIVYRYMAGIESVVNRWQVSPARRLGSTAARVWKSLDKPDPIRLRDGQDRHLGRAAYFGGRVECFKLGHFAPCWYADVTSMYPSVMQDTAMPDPSSMVHYKGLAPDRVPWEKEGVCEAIVHVPQMYVPPLPTRHRGERHFAQGRQHGYWTFLEMRHAMRRGARVEIVRRASWSERSIYPFTLTIGTLWELRELYKREHDPREQTVKGLMNQLYGRFGMKLEMSERRVELCGEDTPAKMHPDWKYHVRHGELYRERERQVWFQHTWVNEIWAAQITAAARVKLHTILEAQGAALIYCDTDSVFTSSPPVGTGEGLGALSLKGALRSGLFLGPKLYSLEQQDGETVAVAKGVKRSLAESFLRGQSVSFERPISPLQMIRGQGRAGQWIEITRSMHLAPARRPPLNPSALESPFGWSDTIPQWYGPEGVEE